jgi:hypothetical protein
MSETWAWTVIGVDFNPVTVGAAIVIVAALAFGFLLMRARKRW